MSDEPLIFNIEAQRLLAGLKYNPGYILLCDHLQAELDNLTDALAGLKLKDEEALPKLRYWQAFRDIVIKLKTEPSNFEYLAGPEEPKEEPFVTDNTWIRLQAQAEKYLNEDNPFPVE